MAGSLARAGVVIRVSSDRRLKKNICWPTAGCGAECSAGKRIIPQGLKPADVFGLDGTAEAVPLPVLVVSAPGGRLKPCPSRSGVSGTMITSPLNGARCVSVALTLGSLRSPAVTFRRHSAACLVAVAARRLAAGATTPLRHE